MGLTKPIGLSGLEWVEWVGVGRSGFEWVGVGRRISMMHGNEVLPLNHLTHSDPRNPLRPTQPTQISHPRLIGIYPDLTQFHLIEKENVISLVRNKLEDHFKEKFRKETGNSSKLNLYSSMRDDFKEGQYISDVKYRTYFYS